MNTLDFCFDRVLCYKLLAMQPDYIQARRRYEERLAALKESGRLCEDKDARYSTSRDTTTAH
jgi:hypothetical protein